MRVTQIGTYELCFDNRYSHINDKTVFFEIYCEIEDASFEFVRAATQKIVAENAATGAAVEEMEGTIEQVKVCK